VKRAYLELERAGLIVTRQGRGSFVADDAGLGMQLHHEELDAHLAADAPLAAARVVIFVQMVDDPSTYVDTLLAQPNLKRKAEATLEARIKRWEEATALAAKARAAGTEAPDPGERPTLEDTIAEIERQRLFRIIRYRRIEARQGPPPVPRRLVRILGSCY
jgi:hypothetical protein